MLSILFLMWFLSGMVMMYHSYPSLSNEARMAHAEQIESCDTLVHSQPTPPLSALSLQQVAGRPVFTMTDSLGETLVDALTGQPVSRFSSAELQHIANRWQSPHVYANQATLIDTLNAIDVWLIGVMPFKEYPIYHYDLNDTVGSELYLSSRTGRPLQLTDTKSRFWAWVGAIPHWIYITKQASRNRQTALDEYRIVDFGIWHCHDAQRPYHRSALTLFGTPAHSAKERHIPLREAAFTLASLGWSLFRIVCPHLDIQRFYVAG